MSVSAGDAAGGGACAGVAAAVGVHFGAVDAHHVGAAVVRRLNDVAGPGGVVAGGGSVGVLVVQDVQRVPDVSGRGCGGGGASGRNWRRGGGRVHRGRTWKLEKGTRICH